MIQANELRIGNYITLGEAIEFYKVVAIDSGNPDDTVTLEGDDWLESFQEASLSPIPLSPEVFRAAGFAQSFTSDPQEPDASQVFEISWLSIHQHSEKENKFYWYNGDVEVEIKSLHQLQNLYFALTSKELTYNP